MANFPQGEGESWGEIADKQAQTEEKKEKLIDNLIIRLRKEFEVWQGEYVEAMQNESDIEDLSILYSDDIAKIGDKFMDSVIYHCDIESS